MLTKSQEDHLLYLTKPLMQFRDKFLQQVIVSDGPRCVDGCCDERVCEAIEACWSSGQSAVVNGGEFSPAIACLPVWKASDLRGVVAFVVAQRNPLPCGVLEIWAPVGNYQDLALTTGYFGDLERFQNVSSFVRFERGSGLPGQAWDRGLTVIHNDLKNHPGFLRAAGASAESLETAIGIPLISDSRAESAVIISSSTTPFSRACEVWTPSGDGEFLLADTYVATGSAPPPEYTLGQSADDKSFAAFVAAQQRPVLSDEASFKSCYPDSQAVLGIPTFVGGELNCVTVLVF